MVTVKRILEILLGIATAILALALGWVFLSYFGYTFGTIIGVLVILLSLGYIYIIIGIVMLKRWAYKMFFTIVILAIFVEILFIVVGGSQGNFIEGLAHSIFWVSWVAIPVFGISAFVRMIAKRIKRKQ